MKKLITVAAMVIVVVMIGTCQAKDQIIDLKISKIMSKVDKNGDDYNVIIVEVPKTLNGIAYNGSMVVMSFSTTYEQSAILKAGENLRAIVNIRKYQGRNSATLLAILQ